MHIAGTEPGWEGSHIPPTPTSTPSPAARPPGLAPRAPIITLTVLTHSTVSKHTNNFIPDVIHTKTLIEDRSRLIQIPSFNFL